MANRSKLMKRAYEIHDSGPEAVVDLLEELEKLKERAGKFTTKDRREPCPVCGRAVRLRKDGTIEQHTMCGGGRIVCEASKVRARNFADRGFV